MKKIAILGCGQLGSIVADAIASGLLPGYTLCAAMSQKLPDAEALCAKAGGAACVTLDEVLAQKPDYVVETAAVQVAKESCLPVLEAGLGFIPISIGACGCRFLRQGLRRGQGPRRAHLPAPRRSGRL